MKLSKPNQVLNPIMRGVSYMIHLIQLILIKFILFIHLFSSYQY